jgi:hypothetical protein
LDILLFLCSWNWGEAVWHELEHDVDGECG